MVTIDASAFLAVILREPEAEAFAVRIAEAGGGVMSSVNLWEAVVRARTLHGDAGAEKVKALVAKLNIHIASATQEHCWTAADAFARYGRRTPADLNLGDCFAYALAQEQGDGLLFKGDDFPKTDVKSAI